MSVNIKTGIDEEELLRQQREAEERALQEQKRAAAEAKKAEEEAADAAAENEKQAKAATEQAQKVAQDVAKQGAKVDIGPTNRPFTEEQSFLLHQRKAVRDTDTDIVKVGDLERLPAELEPHREMLEEKNRKGEIIPSAVNDWGTNRIDINFGSIKDNNQAGFFATTLATDSDKLTFFKEYAARTGQNYYTLLNEAEAKLGTRLFSTPQTQTAKIKACNQGLSGLNLMDVDGNALDLNTATQPQIEQAIRMLPDTEDHKDAVAYLVKLGEMRGWTIDKDSLDFMDSADLTQKDYNDAVDEYNKLFTFGYTEKNKRAYLEELAYIQGQGYKPRVQKQMEAALKKSYEKRTGKIAPPADEIRAVLNQEEADGTVGVDGRISSFGQWMDQAGTKINNALDNLFRGKGEAKKKEPDPLIAQEEEKEAQGPQQQQATGSTGASSYAAAGGAMTSAAPVSSYAASTEPETPKEVQGPEYQAQEIAPEDAGEMGEVQGPVQKEQTEEPTRYTRDIAYDPDMTDEQALAYYLGGGTLDARNREQIAWLTDDAVVRGVVTGLNPKDFNWDAGRSIYDGTQYWQYGPTIRNAAQIRDSGILTDDMNLSASLVLGRAVKMLREDAANPEKGISIPAGENMFEYMLSLPQYEGVRNSLTSITNAQKDIARISAENEIEAKNAHLADVQNWTAQVMAGNATPETLAMLADEHENGEYVNFNTDPTYARLKFQLGPRSDFFDDNGTFWTGDSAAAIEGQNIRTLGGVNQTYSEYKTALKSEAESILENYTVAAMRMGMTLEDYLGSAGIGNIGQILDIAYNNMQAAGSIYGKDTEAQQVVQTVVDNPESVGIGAAAWTGGRRAVEDRTARLMQASYLMLEQADYQATVKELTNSYFARYGEEAPQMYYSDLMAVIGSGQLSEATAQELLANIQTTPNIFEIGYEIDGGLLESLLRDPAETIARDVETLDAVIAKMPERERFTANLVGSAADMLYGMSVATAIGAVTGSPFAGSAVAWGLPAVDQKYDDLAGTGMTKNTRFYVSMAYGGATALANKAGTGGAMDIWGDLSKEAQRKAYMSKGMPGLIKASLKLAAQHGAQEAVEEAGEVGIDYVFDVTQDAVQAYDRGENPKLSRAFQITLGNIYETDVREIGRELLTSAGMGFAMGGIFALAGAARSGYAAQKGVKMERKYGSISLARQIVDGEVELTEESVGKVYAQVQKDLSDPGFKRWIDSANAAAREQNNMVTAAMMGAGRESRNAAVKEANRAADYREKAAAAKSAAQTAESRWIELRQQVMDGDLSLVPAMTTAQQQMGKAFTALREAETAASKAETLATEKTRQWLAACGTFNSQAMAFKANQARAVINQRAAAIDRQELGNVTAMEAESFMDERYPDADDETRAVIMESPAWQEQTETVPETERPINPEVKAALRNAVSFAAQVSRRFGVAIDFVDSIEGGAQGKYEKGRIILDKKNATQGEVIRRVLVHELTHRAEGSKWYGELRDALLEIGYKGDSSRLSADITSKMKTYNDHAARTGSGKVYTEADIEQEVVADLAGELFTGSEETINALVAEKPSLMRRVYETVRDFVRKLRGVSDPTLEKIRKAERIMRKALDTAKGKTDGSQFSLQKANDGTPYVRVDTDQDIFEGHEPSEYPAIAKEYIKTRFRHTVIGEGENRAYVDAKTGNEYTHPAKRVDQEAFSGKMKASTELDNLLKASKFIKNSGPEKRHPEFPGGFDLHDVIFEVSGKAFEGRINIGIDNSGRRRLYDMTKIKSLDPEIWVKRRGDAAAQVGHQSSNTIIPETAPVSNRKYSLPSADVLNQEISAYRASRSIEPRTAVERQESTSERVETNGQGERQFATQTAQRSEAMPQWLKNELMNNPNQRYYDRDTNDAQLMRAWERYQQEGYEGVRDRLLAADHFTADDTADANMIMAIAFRNEDVGTALQIAQKYNEEGTKQGQALQARQIFKRMSPTGIRQWAAGEAERNLSEHIRTHSRQRRDVDMAARRVAERIRDMQGGEEALRLNAAGTYTVDSTNNRWGVPINEQQQALIEQYNLEGVERPGLFYNRATRRQRMLEAILATPNPLEVTGNGLNLIQRLEYMQDGVAVITNADLNYIGSQLAQYAAMDADMQQEREGDLALARAYEAYGNIYPATLEEKARTWRYTSMLLSVPSALRNVIGNAAQNTVNATAHGIAVELDRMAAAVTGRERTMAHLSIQERVEGWNAFVEETKNTFRDFFIDRAITSTMRGDDRFNADARGRVYETGIWETARLAEGYLMSVGDRNFWKRAYVNSIAEQQRVADRNGVELDYAQAAEIARAEADYATFNEDSNVRNLFSQMKNSPNPIIRHVVDFIMPFTGVPTNITRRMIEYSPAGLLGTVINRVYAVATRADVDARAFYTELARGLTGTALFGIGMILKEAGLIRLGTGDEDDNKVYGVRTAQGDQYTPYIRIGDEYVSLAAFAPSVSPLIMGATAFDLFKEDDEKLGALLNACLAGFDQIFDASYMSSLQDIFKGYGSPAENIGNAVFSSAVSQNVPALFGQMATAMDPYVRDTKDKSAIMQALKSGLIAKIPGLREMLPEKVDVAGKSVISKEGLRNFFDPLTTTKAADDPVLDELMRLYDATGESSFMPSDALSGTKNTLTVNKEKITVDGKDKEAYKKRYGELWYSGVARLMAKPNYKRMSAEDRMKKIKEIVADAKKQAAAEIAKEIKARK